MKKDERKVYLVLANEIDWGLCGFCKYSEYDGSVCSDVSFSCNHPLLTIVEHSEEIDPGDDCKGYRPEVKIADVADIVGIILSQNFDPSKSMWSISENGQIEVGG